MYGHTLIEEQDIHKCLSCRTLHAAHRTGGPCSLGHPFHEHLVKLVVQLFESLALLLEQTACHWVVRAGRRDVGFVVDNHEQVANVVFVV